MKSKPLVSVILLNFNGLNFTLDCIKSLKKTTYPNFEIIVVDNGSSDNSVKELRKIKEIKLIESKENTGFAEGNNIGVRNSNGEIISILNNDTTVEPDWIDEPIKILTTNNKVGGVQSNVLSKYGNDKYQPMKRLMFSIFGYPIIGKMKDNNIFSLTGCALFYRKKDIDIPFDKDYFIYFEDVSLAWKLRLKGLINKQSWNSKVYHYGGAVVQDMTNLNNFFVKLGERNKYYNLLLFYETKTLLKITPLLILTIILNNLYSPKTIPLRIKSYASLFYNLPKILKKRKKIQYNRKVSDKNTLKYMSYKILDEKSLNSSILNDIIIAFNKLSYYYCKLTGIKTYEMT